MLRVYPFTATRLVATVCAVVAHFHREERSAHARPGGSERGGSRGGRAGVVTRLTMPPMHSRLVKPSRIAGDGPGRFCSQALIGMCVPVALLLGVQARMVGDPAGFWGQELSVSRRRSQAAAGRAARRRSRRRCHRRRRSRCLR